MSEPDPGAAKCTLSGVPTVSILDPHGKTMAIHVAPIPSPSPAVVVIEPGLPLPPENVALLVGQAGFQVFWFNWCGPNPGTSGTLVVGRQVRERAACRSTWPRRPVTLPATGPR